MTRRTLIVVIATVLLMAAGATEALAAPTSLTQVINNLRNWLVGLLVAIATLMATIGGLRLLLAGGDPGEVAKGKNALRSAAIGYGIAALAPLAVQILRSIIGV
ncbi:hypothetical protein [Acrocarpospora sp. B8E8]|uniref:hypothetical protein n=1 Tax=Acrocarpospora sp. B8E8 TaxID=3153572 RepID=UPI00325D5E82